MTREKKIKNADERNSASVATYSGLHRLSLIGALLHGTNVHISKVTIDHLGKILKLSRLESLKNCFVSSSFTRITHYAI